MRHTDIYHAAVAAGRRIHDVANTRLVRCWMYVFVITSKRGPLYAELLLDPNNLLYSCQYKDLVQQSQTEYAVAQSLEEHY